MQDAIDRKGDNAVDAQMVLADAEFEKIALVTNPSIIPDRIKYAKEVADAKIASDAKAAADAKAAEAKALAVADAKIATDILLYCPPASRLMHRVETISFQLILSAAASAWLRLI